MPRNTQRPFDAHGFTLIELVMVVVILGVLAAVALPRFVSLKDDAEHAVVKSFVGNLATARSLFIIKAAVCGAGYPTEADAVFTTFVSYPSSRGWTTGCSAPYNTISTEPIIPSLSADPNANIVQSSTAITITTKTGRQVNISLDTNNGAISWTATPSY